MLKFSVFYFQLLTDQVQDCLNFEISLMNSVHELLK